MEGSHPNKGFKLPSNTTEGHASAVQTSGQKGLRAPTMMSANSNPLIPSRHLLYLPVSKHPAGRGGGGALVWVGSGVLLRKGPLHKIPELDAPQN